MSLDLNAIEAARDAVESRAQALIAFAEKALEFAQGHAAAASEGAQAVAALSQVSDHMKKTADSIDAWLSAHSQALDAIAPDAQ